MNLCLFDKQKQCLGYSTNFSKLPIIQLSCSNDDIGPSNFAAVKQIVVGSFLAGDQHEQRTKKNKSDSIVAAVPLSTTEMDDHPFHSSVKQTVPTSSSFRADNWSALAPDSRNKPAEINVTTQPA